jgi:LPXTG-site transpeptidase (sortase) family protein
VVRIRVLVSVILASVLVLAALAPALAYIQQRDGQVLVSAPNVVKCDRVAKIKAKVVEAKSGKPITKQIVRWGLAASQSSGDRLSAASTKTNSNGWTSVVLSFGPAAGRRTVRATIAGGSSSVTIRCAGGLPKTSPIMADDDVQQPPALVVAATPPPRTDPGTLPATAVRVDRLGIDLPLLEGDGVTVPEGVAMHYPGTAWPGEGSNTYLYAHAREGHFLELWQVRSGDRVEVDMADGSVAHYQVSEIRPVVPWDALEYLSATDSEVLTLQTCLTYDETAPRFVVIAERVVGA